VKFLLLTLREEEVAGRIFGPKRGKYRRLEKTAS
jgi:hypothetical protein